MSGATADSIDGDTPTLRTVHDDPWGGGSTNVDLVLESLTVATGALKQAQSDLQELEGLAAARAAAAEQYYYDRSVWWGNYNAYILGGCVGDPPPAPPKPDFVD